METTPQPTQAVTASVPLVPIPETPTMATTVPGSPTVAPNREATASALHTGCARSAKLLAGGPETDRSLLDTPEVKELATRAQDLVVCGAVRIDSDLPCELLGNPHGTTEEDWAVKDCVLMRSLFHELRTRPAGSWIFFSDAEYRACLASVLAPICDSFREALRAADRRKCVLKGSILKGDPLAVCRDLTNLTDAACRGFSVVAKKGMEARCRAFVDLAPSACDAKIAFAGSHQEADPGLKPFAKDMENECRQYLENRAAPAKGLKELARSGSGRERELAKAALGRPDACAAFEKAAIDFCAPPIPTAPVDTPAPPAPDATTTTGPAATPEPTPPAK